MKKKIYLLTVVFTFLGLVSTQWVSAQNVTIRPTNGSMICALTGSDGQNQLGFQIGAFGTWIHEQLSLTMTGSNYTDLTEDGMLASHSNHFITGDKCTFNPSIPSETAANYIVADWGGSNLREGYITIALPKGYRFTSYRFNISHDVARFGVNNTSFSLTTNTQVTMTETNESFTANGHAVQLPGNSSTVQEYTRTGDDMGNVLYFKTTANSNGFYAICFRYIELTFTADADAPIAITPGEPKTNVSMVEVPFSTGKIDFGDIKPGTYGGANRISYQFNTVSDMSANMLLYEKESVQGGTGFDGTSGDVAYNRTGSISTTGDRFKLTPSGSDEQVYFLETPVSAKLSNNIENPIQFRIVEATVNYTNQAHASTFDIAYTRNGTKYYLGTNGYFSTTRTIWTMEGNGNIHNGNNYLSGTGQGWVTVSNAAGAGKFTIDSNNNIKNSGGYLLKFYYSQNYWGRTTIRGVYTNEDEYSDINVYATTAEFDPGESVAAGAKLYVYDAAGENPEEITISGEGSKTISGLNNDAIKIGVKGGSALVNFSLKVQALNPYIDQMTVVMNDNENGLRMTLPFTTDDFSVGGDVFNFYLPADCEGDKIDMTFEDLYSKYGDDTYDHVQEKGTSDSRYNYVMSQHNQAFGTDDNIYNNKTEAASDTKESERITNNSMIRTQVGIAGTEAFRFNNADVLSSESGVMTEYPFTKAHYASFQDKDGNTVNGEFKASSFDSASETGETKHFYVFTTDETKYNIAPTTATQHRFYAFYKMTVFVQVATYDPIANFEPIYTESFYEAADGTNQKGAFYGVKITTPEGITNGMASDVAIYKAISDKLGGTGAPASLDQILYLDLSALGGVYHLNLTTDMPSYNKYKDYQIADFEKLREKFAKNAIVYLPLNTTSTFNNFAYKMKGETVAYKSSNNIELTDKQPFFAPYDIQVDAKNNVKYTRGLSRSTYTSAKRTTLILPFTIKLTNGLNSDGSLKFFQLQPNNAAKDNVDNYGPAMLFEPTSDTKVQANTPYALENLNGETEFTITESGSNIVATPAAAKSGNSFFSAEEMTSTGSLGGQSYTFNHVGTYSGRELSKTTTFFYFANGGFYSSSDLSSNYNTVKAYPFRSIYTTGTNPTAKIGYIYFLEGFYDDATGIKDVSKSLTGISVGDGTITITADADNSYRIYSTTGQNIDAVSLKAGESRTVSVPAGIYLVNGVKVLVK